MRVILMIVELAVAGGVVVFLVVFVASTLWLQ